MVARLTTDRSLAKENSSCNPTGLAWPQPKQRFSATWARGVRFSWAEVIELSIVRQDFRVGLLIDVAAAQNDPDALPISLFVLLQRSGQRSRARAFGQVVSVLMVGAHGVGDFLLGDFDNAGDILPDDFHRLGIGCTAGQPVSDGCAGWGLHHRVLPKAECVGRRCG